MAKRAKMKRKNDKEFSPPLPDFADEPAMSEMSPSKIRTWIEFPLRVNGWTPPARPQDAAAKPAHSSSKPAPILDDMIWDD